jgi:hypothetical protein
MGVAHQQINAVLRADDNQHIYFQEPSGWSYWGAEYWPGMMNGNDIGDPNRNFCPKWKTGAGDPGLDLDTKGTLAAESNAPMFMCEVWVDRGTGTDADVVAQQRGVLKAMDDRLIGGVRVLYGPSDSYGTQTSTGGEAAWVQEFVRPYPMWAGGRITSSDYDFDARQLTLGVALDGSGPTEVFVPQARTYPGGFVAAASTGERLEHDGAGVVSAAGMTWDATHQRVVLPAGSGPVAITVAPR